MKTTFQFQTTYDKQKILSDNPTLTLIEEQYLINGNFIILSDNPSEDTKVTTYLSVPGSDFNNMQTENTQLKTQLTQMSTDFQGLTDLLAEKGVI